MAPDRRHPDRGQPDRRQDNQPAAETRDFGYTAVPPDAHRRLVDQVFASVAPRYDLMNDLMSGGLHRGWKAVLLNRLRLRPGEVLVDLAGGTGDVALGALRRARAKGGTARAVIADPAVAMMSIARDRAIDRGMLSELALVAADAARLPFADGAADACTIAFGLRNVTLRAAALAEARRILRPGGRFYCLEFSHVVLPALRPLYDAYSFRVLPLLGRWVAGDADSYRYLAESIRRFPDQETLAAEMRRAGFDRVSHDNLSGGIVALHAGWRL